MRSPADYPTAASPNFRRIHICSSAARRQRATDDTEWLGSLRRASRCSGCTFWVLLGTRSASHMARRAIWDTICIWHVVKCSSNSKTISLIVSIGLPRHSAQTAPNSCDGVRGRLSTLRTRWWLTENSSPPIGSSPPSQRWCALLSVSQPAPRRSGSAKRDLLG